MLKGDLTTTPLAPLLLSLAEEESTGCLHISDAEGDEALIYFKTGLVYAVFVPGRRPQLGAKLVSSGALTPEALAEALDAQRTELQGWKLGELLVHLGFVDQPVVEAFVREQVHDAVWDLIRWTEGRWRFRKNEKTREDVAPPMTVQELLENLRERGVEWEAISDVVHGPTAVPVLSARGGGAPETTLDADAWSMLCKIDGERSVAELARDCGYTLFEAGQVLVTLVQAGLVDIEEDVEVVPPTPAPEDNDELYGASEVMSALTAAFGPGSTEDVAEAPVEDVVPEQPLDNIAEIARLVSEVAAGVRDDEIAAAVQEVPSPVSIRPVADEDSFALSVDRVSAALADVLGPAPDVHDPYEVPAEMRVKKASQQKSRLPERTPESDRRDALRAAAAAELAAAHALAEALRQERESADQQAVQEAARAADEAARTAAEEAARIAAEEEAARLAAEQEAARIAAEEEAARIAAEEEAARVAAAEEAARIAAEEEAARLAAEEEAARIAAEQEEAARIAAEEEAARLAAEEEAARIAAEQEEAARIAAEEEAARLAAEDEAARIAAEQEAARIAAEEEAARIAAEEEAARIAAEQEAARIAAEEEAARIAAEQEEAARIAAEEEAARLAAEQEEAARIAAEEEAARLAAEQEAARLAAEEEARLLAEEIAQAEDEAWGEYWTREAEEITRREADAERAAADEAERLAVEEADRLAVEEAARLAAEQAEAAAAAEAEEDQRRTSLAEADERERRSSAAALLAELATQVVDSPEPVAEADDAPMPAELEDETEDNFADEPAELEPAYAGASRDMADTAALLRELSSLGLEDDPPVAAPPAPRSPTRPPTPAPAAAKKKKRGLFGL